MGTYRFNLNTYKYPPKGNCATDDLEKIAAERLQLYKIMNNASNLELKPNSKEWDEYINSNIIKHKLKTYMILLKSEVGIVGLFKARRNNHIAHWLLSLCYCRNDALRYFFMCCELYWFTMLYKRTKAEDLKDFLTENNFNYKEVNLGEELPFKQNQFFEGNDRYYKTEFTEITSLVTERRVFLHRGFAYFPEKDIIYCVKTRLWRQFNQQLQWTNKMIPTAIKEDRIKDLFLNIPLVTSSDIHTTESIPKINLNNIDDIAERHFPLCMVTIHEELRNQHHLKYDCKMQYGVFLKCLGLDYEDAMTFWKQEFTEKMSSDWFNRKYSYLFKHQYGKVGSRLDYKPYSCSTIQSTCPEPGQHHGCPFKHWDVHRLLERCQNDGIKGDHVRDIKELVANGKYKEACTVYFCGRFKIIRDTIVESPNKYFSDSFVLEKAIDDYFDTIFEDCQVKT